MELIHGISTWLVDIAAPGYGVPVLSAKDIVQKVSVLKPDPPFRKCK